MRPASRDTQLSEIHASLLFSMYNHFEFIGEMSKPS